MLIKVLAVALIVALAVVAVVAGWRTGTAYADRKAERQAADDEESSELSR